MITLRCPTCGKTLSIDDQYAGQAGKCNALRKAEAMSQHEIRKDAARRAAEIASEQRQAARMARDVGVPRSNIYTFINRGVLGPETLEKVIAWLAEHGYLPPEQVRETPQGKSPCGMISRELRLCAELLESGFPLAEVAERVHVIGRSLERQAKAEQGEA